MSYNGSGTFVINSSGQPVVTGTVISSTAFNALTADLGTGLSTAITKDGQTTTTSRILFAQGVSSTLVTDATSTTTGSIITAGGISCQKAAVVGTLLGVGMAPVNVLDITQTQNGLSIAKLTNASAGAASRSIVQISNGTNYAFFGQNGTGYTTSGLDIQDGTRIFAGGNGGLVLQTGAATPIYFAVNNSEAARIGTSGGLLIGTTTENAKLAIVGSTSSQGIFVNSSASGDDAIYAQNGGGLVGSCITCNVGGPTTYLQVFKFQGSAVGTITTNGTTTAYNTTSDYRLKENVQLMTGGLDTIAALKPVTYDWISNGSAGKGFIAHELQAVIPEAVYGEKDALDKDGSIKPQGVDFGKIVPHLVAAMQEQQATIQELTTRLAALENKT